jgi:hypothetical protein
MNCLACAAPRFASHSLPTHTVLAIASLSDVSDSPHVPPDRCLGRLSLGYYWDARSVASGVGRLAEIPSKGRVAEGSGRSANRFHNGWFGAKPSTVMSRFHSGKADRLAPGRQGWRLIDSTSRGISIVMTKGSAQWSGS